MINATYTLDVYIEEIEEHSPASDTIERDYPVLFVRLTTQPMPAEPDPYRLREMHPFALLAQGRGGSALKELFSGVYEEYFPDNTVTRAILEMLRGPEKIKEGAGYCDLPWMRARLINALDILWD